MHGEIVLESKLGVGTTATFWIPFKKADQGPDATALVGLDSIPERLQSDLSVSCGSSEMAFPSATSSNAPGDVRSPQRRKRSAPIGAALLAERGGSAGLLDSRTSLSQAERNQVQVLVVEDK